MSPRSSSSRGSGRSSSRGSASRGGSARSGGMKKSAAKKSSTIKGSVVKERRVKRHVVRAAKDETKELVFHKGQMYRPAEPASAKKSAAPAVGYKSDAFAAIHQSALALLDVGAITQTTMREFDEDCLTAPEPLSPQDIKRLREENHVSQPVFAKYLNTSESTVAQWESGAKRPGGPALKLLSIVRKLGLDALG